MAYARRWQMHSKAVLGKRCACVTEAPRPSLSALPGYPRRLRSFGTAPLLCIHATVFGDELHKRSVPMVEERADPCIKRGDAIYLVARQFVIEHIEIFGDALGEDGFVDHCMYQQGRSLAPVTVDRFAVIDHARYRPKAVLRHLRSAIGSRWDISTKEVNLELFSRLGFVSALPPQTDRKRSISRQVRWLSWT